ncbi:MAG: 1-(5-phosphoribosyl)-5-[(5-phosphoribosylamino)methylideneamino]imidazole-4-carboxamide isomerase [Candidatus Hydrothermarchaeota archaeon]|nr:1-(5-phosphoribosyl)-5-[(5-phosphoribosylamino)methylideneamino]imidazole-4-carboxamide isomerase [Candidatus Hydrothermarchaeota archaeon]
MFLTIPAVDLKDGKCVQLRQGLETEVLLELKDPLGVAKRWERVGAPRLHVVDLDGAIKGMRVNEDILMDIVNEVRIPVQFGGGVRRIEDARKLLDFGVEKIIVGTMALENPVVLGGLVEKYGKDRVIVALDSRGGEVVVKGWKAGTGIVAKEVIRNFESYAREVLFTNVDMEGLMKGVNEVAIEEVVKASSLDVIVSGGVSSVEDIKKVRSLGAKGVVIGSALYTGKLDYKEALKVARGT